MTVTWTVTAEEYGSFTAPGASTQVRRLGGYRLYLARRHTESDHRNDGLLEAKPAVVVAEPAAGLEYAESPTGKTKSRSVS